MKIVGSVCCPVGPSAGHDADESRANLIEDGSVLCVTCATRYPKMGDTMKRVWQSICKAGFNTPQVHLGSHTKPGTPAYDASCLSGYDPLLSDRVQATFVAADATVVLSYEQSVEPELASPDRSLHMELSAEQKALLPARVQLLLESLPAQGFCLRQFQTERGLRLVLSCGRPVGKMGFVLGATVEITC